jgi:gamma-glutamylcyclotransferase (GGCT)/AIG2-like uncharacterized protein YtfP
MRFTDMRLFVYGTLLDATLVRRLTGQPANARPARLAGFRRVRLRGTPYPTLARGRGTVYGAVLRVDGRAFRRLNAYEGPRYRLHRVRPRLLASRATVAALAWIAPGATRHSWP